MANLGIIGTQPTTFFKELLMADDIMPGSDVSYQLCKQIYLYHPLGGKMVDKPIRMAQSQERDITIPKGPEEKLRERFVKEWKALGATQYIGMTARLARIYGVSAIVVLSRDIDGAEVDAGEPLDFSTLYGADIVFNVYDPLNVAGSMVSQQSPLSYDFLKPRPVVVGGKQFNASRVVVMMNEQPIYLGYTVSSFGYVGRSVYQRALYPMKSFIKTMIADDMVATKIGVLIAKIKQAGSIIDGMMQSMFGQKRDVLKEAETYNVISIGPEDDVSTINMQNVDGPMTRAKASILENIAAADDMPAQMLNNETFAGQGFGEGAEDSKAVAQYVDKTRIDLQPLYTFFDKIVQYRAWNRDFYAAIQSEFPDEYGKVPYETAFSEWTNSFEAAWPSLLKEPDSEKVKTDDVKLKGIISAVTTYAPLLDPENKVKLMEWGADNINANKVMFTTPLDLDFEAALAFAEEQQTQQENAMLQQGQPGEGDAEGGGAPAGPPKPKIVPDKLAAD